jgi:hypothetical protein
VSETVELNRSTVDRRGEYPERGKYECKYEYEYWLGWSESVTRHPTQTGLKS